MPTLTQKIKKTMKAQAFTQSQISLILGEIRNLDYSEAQLRKLAWNALPGKRCANDRENFYQVLCSYRKDAIASFQNFVAVNI